MPELEPGPELDRRVAEAMGIARSEFPVWRWTGSERAEPFSPSTDLNAAFAAAEKVGLFGGDYRLRLGKEWEVVAEADLLINLEVFASAPTPALAICAAILSLKAKDAQATATCD